MSLGITRTNNLLSRRILHFTKNHTYFACGHGVRRGNVMNKTMCNLTICITIVLLLTWTSNLNSSSHPTESFILEPEFPSCLQTSGYRKIIKFVQSLLEQYAQAGLSKESDREIAISGLLQRMKHVLESECRYGISKCFLSRLLLWRVSVDVDGSIANAGTVDQ